MTPAELQKLVNRGEGQQLEFKHKIQFPEKIAREIVAFANTDGGTLLIGVDDNKQIFGLKNPDEELYALDVILKKYIRFPVVHTKKLIPMSHKKSVIAMHVHSAEQKPNYALEKPGQRYGKAYVRHLDKSIQASDLVVEYLKALSKPRKPHQISELDTKILHILTQNATSTTILTLGDILLVSQSTLRNSIVQLALLNLLRIVPREMGADLLQPLEVL